MTLEDRTLKQDKMILGIIAGKGDVPINVAKSAFNKSIETYTICISGYARISDFQDYSKVKSLNIGMIGAALRFFKENNVTHVTIAGAVKRPSLFSIRVDAHGARLLKRIISKKILGDDSLLREIGKFFEENNLVLIAFSDIMEMAPSNLPEFLTEKKPSKENLLDIQIGKDYLKKLSPLDIGQSIIISEKRVISIEAAEGTDNLIKRTKELLDKSQSSVLVKAPKIGQDKRLDTPTIGVETVKNIFLSGIDGIAVQRGNVNIVGINDVIEEANRSGIFIYVFE